MSYEVKVLADSISPQGIRLTTIDANFPRFILAEVNTHRMMSRNSASSRAIPPEDKMDDDGNVIAKGLFTKVRDTPFIPETFNERVKGMGVGDPVDEKRARDSAIEWVAAAQSARGHAVKINSWGIDKSRVNRLLEPFLWHRAIISATEWSNFFALRDHPEAQPEFQIVAKKMRQLMYDAVEGSKPQELKEGEWHLPLLTKDELAIVREDRHQLTNFKMVSAGRCARVSYDTHENYETNAASYARSEVLMGNGHMSPFEHVARPFSADENTGIRLIQSEIQNLRTMIGNELTEHLLESVEFCGNFRGWLQMRKQLTHESDFAKVLEAAK